MVRRIWTVCLNIDSRFVQTSHSAKRFCSECVGVHLYAKGEGFRSWSRPWFTNTGRKRTSSFSCGCWWKRTRFSHVRSAQSRGKTSFSIQMQCISYIRLNSPSYMVFRPLWSGISGDSLSFYVGYFLLSKLSHLQCWKKIFPPNYLLIYKYYKKLSVIWWGKIQHNTNTKIIFM